MNTIAPAIKRRRVQMGLTQKEMAERIHLSEKAWQNIENGITRLDIERLQQIAEVLEMSMMDLVNNQETLYIHQTNNDNSSPQIGDNNVVNHYEAEKQLYDKLLAEKDERIKFLMEELAVVKGQLNGFIEKVMKG
jgi:transcriptional regulator with XRE-family HTH domain